MGVVSHICFSQFFFLKKCAGAVVPPPESQSHLYVSLFYSVRCFLSPGKGGRSAVAQQFVDNARPTVVNIFREDG